MRKKFYFTVLLFILLPAYCMAAQYAVKKQDVSFGKFTQTSENAEIYLSPDGSITAVGGRVSNGVAGIIHYSLEDTKQDVMVKMPDTYSIYEEGIGCKFEIYNHTYNPQQFNLYVGAPSEQDVYIGATLRITGMCEPGTYSTTYYVNPTVNGYYSGFNTPIRVSLIIEEKIGIRETQSLDFGTLVSPAADSTVTVDYNGSRRSSGNIHLHSSKASNGVFQLEGIAGRKVNVTFPSSVDIGGGMVVSNFTTDTGLSFPLEAERQNMNVGATLNVPAGTPEGEYSGQYTVIVSY